MKIDENLILVFYIDVREVPEDEIPEFMYQVGKKLEINNGFYLPIFGESRVECINPVYITNDELIKKHERLMAELHEHLKNQLDGKEG